MKNKPYAIDVERINNQIQKSCAWGVVILAIEAIVITAAVIIVEVVKAK